MLDFILVMTPLMGFIFICLLCWKKDKEIYEQRIAELDRIQQSHKEIEEHVKRLIAQLHELRKPYE